MSIVEVLLSRREIVLSLALVFLILIMALLLAVGPVLRRRWKRAMKQRRVKRAAKLARLKEQRNRARQAALAAQADLIAEEPMELPAEEEVPLEPEIPTEPAEEEEPLDPALSELQSMFEGVFEDEEVNARYATLLKGTEPISAEQLAELANKVADQLGAQKQEQPRDDS